MGSVRRGVAYPVNRGMATVGVDGVPVGVAGVVDGGSATGGSAPGGSGAGGVGGTVSTSGPVTSHTEREMYTSPLARTPARWTWIAVTVIELIDPTTSVRVCSFRVMVATLASEIVVFGAGV